MRPATYFGWRDHLGYHVYKVLHPKACPLPDRRDIKSYCPQGFSWDDRSGGCLQLAFALAFDTVRDLPDVEALTHPLWEVLSDRLSGDAWALTEEDLRSEITECWKPAGQPRIHPPWSHDLDPRPSSGTFVEDPEYIPD